MTFIVDFLYMCALKKVKHDFGFKKECLKFILKAHSLYFVMNRLCAF